MNIEISPKEYEKKLNWYDAMMYCQLLVIDNKNDWRLPTIDELKDIYNSENDFAGSYCWSSTEGNGSKAWLQDMYSGNQFFNGYKEYSFYARPVRSLII